MQTNGSQQQLDKDNSIQKQSVLADPYIPFALRSLNLVEASLVLCASGDNSVTDDTVGPLAPISSRCFCVDDTLAPEQAHPVPFRKVLPELYYAVRREAYPELFSVPTRQLPKLDNDIAQMSEYRRCMEHLLLLERECLLTQYERYSQYNVTISVKNPIPATNRLAAHVKIGGIADANPPLKPGDIMLIRPNRTIHVHDAAGSTVEIRTEILSIEKSKDVGRPDRVHFHWLEQDQHNWLQHYYYDGKEYNIRFVPSSDPLERCLTALDWLGSLPENAAKEFLFPNEAPYIPVNEIAVHDPTVEAELSTLNNKQAAFVRLVLGRTRNKDKSLRGPTILTGPAGTGKTKTMLMAIRAVLADDTEHRILVCTPSHTAADVITKRLAEHLNRSQLFRLYDAKRPVEAVPVEVLQFARQSAKQGIFMLPPRAELLGFRVIVCTCTDAHILYRIGLTNAQLRVKRQCFRRYVTRECRETNLLAEIHGVNAMHFSHFFMDEAAQASEAESLIPLSVVVDPGIEMVLVGDPRQLSPDIYSDMAACSGFSRSWMERLLLRPVRCLGGGNHHMLGPELVQIDDWLKYSFQRDGQEQLSIFLTLNYRGHPSTLMMPSALFYSDKLTCIDYDERKTDAVLYWCELLRKVEARSKPVVLPSINLPCGMELRRCMQWPIHCRAVTGTDSSVSLKIASYACNSWVNLAEAEVVVEIAITLTQNGVSTQSIGVMAPFRGQVALIRRKLREKQLGAINVGTVEDYQSVQRDVIILSLTRCTHDFVENDIKNRMGVFGQPKRSNVALTRAESLLVVVGSPLAMSKDLVWKQFLLFCFRNGLLYGDPGSKHIYEWREGCTIVRHLESILCDSDEASDCVVVGSLERLLRSNARPCTSNEIRA